MSGESEHKLLYFSPAWSGGLADYARSQADALVDAGTKVVFLTSRRNEIDPASGCCIRKELSPASVGASGNSRLMHKFELARELVANFRQLARIVKREKFDRVLLGSYVEYLAPIWAAQLRRLASCGVVFGTVVHDPVRDYVVGPQWWHRWSVRAAYSFLREAFVHEAIELDTGRPMPRLRTTVIPHGPYRFPPPRLGREQVRARLKIPREAKVLLSFGQVRDGKNLDLVIRAIARESQAYLVVAGKVSSTTQKPIEYYRAIANEMGVAARCCWLTDFIPADQVGDLFDACDAVLLTYSSNFRSASGVLNAAVGYRRPCI